MPRRYTRHSETLKYLIQRGKSVTNRDIAHMAKARLAGMLESESIEERTRIQAIRVGLEVGGEVGPARELIHKHQIEVPPAAQEMIARRIFELQKNSEAIDAHTGSALQIQDVSIGEESTPSLQSE